MAGVAVFGAQPVRTLLAHPIVSGVVSHVECTKGFVDVSALVAGHTAPLGPSFRPIAMMMPRSEENENNSSEGQS